MKKTIKNAQRKLQTRQGSLKKLTPKELARIQGGSIFSIFGIRYVIGQPSNIC